MSLVAFIQGFTEKYIAYYPKLNHVTGGVLASIFLYELIYQDRYATDPDGVAITDTTWMEILGFSRRELEHARRHLDDQGLILITRKGHPCQNYYKIQRDLIDSLWKEYVETGESVLTRSRKKRTENFKKSPSRSQFVQIEQTEPEVILDCPVWTDYTVQTGQTVAVQVGQTSVSNLDKLSLYVKNDLKNIRNKTNTNAALTEPECLSPPSELNCDRSEIDLEPLETFPDRIDLSIPVQSQIEDSSSRTKTAKAPRAETRSRKKKEVHFSDDFMAFYRKYPRKENRPGASKTYEEFRASGVTHEEIMKSLDLANQDWIRREVPKDKIPHPQTWLNRMPWLELEEPEEVELEDLSLELLEQFYECYERSARFCDADPGTFDDARSAFTAVLLDSSDQIDRLPESAVFYFQFKTRKEKKPTIHKASNFLRLGIWKQMLQIKDKEEQAKSAIAVNDGSAPMPTSIDDYRRDQRYREILESARSAMS